MRLLCVHGWACAPSVWQPMLERLTELMEGQTIQLTTVDLGFYSSESLEDLGQFDLAIGHSFGLLWLLESQLVRFDRLIAINGFTRFSAAEDFQCGWPHRIIQRMQRQLGRDPHQVVSDFLRKAWPSTDAETSDVNNDSTKPIHFGGTLDVERLNWALEALLNRDGREQWRAFEGPKRAIAATKDPIVTVEHTNACFAGSDLQWLKSDCHLLPLKFPEICAALVRETIEVS